jgi:hypothetical protein
MVLMSGVTAARCVAADFGVEEGDGLFTADNAREDAMGRAVMGAL